MKYMRLSHLGGPDYVFINQICSIVPIRPDSMNYIEGQDRCYISMNGCDQFYVLDLSVDALFDMIRNAPTV
jgi:hypothetical protein